MAGGASLKSPEGNEVVSNTTDPLVRLIQQFPIHALIAAAFLLGFFAWLIAFEEGLRRLMGQRRSTGMQTQLDELRRDIRGLEAQRQNFLVRFLNSERWPSSSPVTPVEKNPSPVPAAQEVELVPESPEIAPHEKRGAETKPTMRSTRAMMYYDPSHDAAELLFGLLLFGSFMIGAWFIMITIRWLVS
jgi:hypothetical protein